MPTTQHAIHPLIPPLRVDVVVSHRRPPFFPSAKWL